MAYKNTNLTPLTKRITHIIGVSQQSVWYNVINRRSEETYCIKPHEGVWGSSENLQKLKVHQILCGFEFKAISKPP